LSGNYSANGESAPGIGAGSAAEGGISLVSKIEIWDGAFETSGIGGSDGNSTVHSISFREGTTSLRGFTEKNNKPAVAADSIVFLGKSLTAEISAPLLLSTALDPSSDLESANWSVKYLVKSTKERQDLFSFIQLASFDKAPSGTFRVEITETSPQTQPLRSVLVNTSESVGVLIAVGNSFAGSMEAAVYDSQNVFKGHLCGQHSDRQLTPKGVLYYETMKLCEGPDSIGLSTAALVGIIVGIPLFAIIVIAIVLLCMKRRRSRAGPQYASVEFMSTDPPK
jgi:hypothetical protein